MQVSNQYLENHYFINPAGAGAGRNSLPLRLGARRQWTGLPNAPVTYYFSAYKKIGESTSFYNSRGLVDSYYGDTRKSAVGAIIISDRNGIVENTSFQASYSYQVELAAGTSDAGSTKLAFGLGLSYNQFKLDTRNLNVFHQGDPLISNALESSSYPEANFGLYAFNRKFFAGFAVHNLFESAYRLEEDFFADDLIKRNFYLHTGFNAPLNDEFESEFSILLHGVTGLPSQLDINGRFFYRENFLGISYKTSGSMVGMVGFDISGFRISYAYEYNLNSDLQGASNGTHEIMLGLDINL